MARTASRGGATAFLVFPNGTRVALANGRTVHIGRESDDAGIARACGGYDYVSRNHCSVRVDVGKSAVFVKDEGSTNGTYYGENLSRVYRDETAVALPAVIWLGRQVRLEVRIEGGR